MKSLFILFLILTISISLIVVQDSYALSSAKNHGVSDQQIGSNHVVLGIQTEIETSDIFINDAECNLNTVAVATQWIRFDGLTWIESGITAGKITTNPGVCYNDVIKYYGLSQLSNLGNPTTRTYVDYTVGSGKVGENLFFEIEDIDKNGRWNVRIGEGFPKASIQINRDFLNEQFLLIDYGIESRIQPQEEYSNIPDTQYRNMKYHVDGNWKTSPFFPAATNHNDYLLKKCNSTHWVAGNVLDVKCNRNTVSNSAPIISNVNIADTSNDSIKKITVSATDIDSDYLTFYIKDTPAKGDMIVNNRIVFQPGEKEDLNKNNHDKLTFDFEYKSKNKEKDDVVLYVTDQRTGHAVSETITLFEKSTGGGGGNPPQDTTAPKITFSPVDGTIIRTDSVTITVSASDPSGIYSISISGPNEQQSKVKGQTSLTHTFTGLTNGVNNFTIVSLDDSPKFNKVTVLFDLTVNIPTPPAVDEDGPIITITSPTNLNKIITTDSVIISATSSDPSGVKEMEIFQQIGRERITVAGNNISNEFTGLKDDVVNKFFVFALDNQNNRSVKTVKLMVNLPTPPLAPTIPTTPPVITHDKVTISWTAPESKSTILEYDIQRRTTGGVAVLSTTISSIDMMVDPIKFNTIATVSASTTSYNDTTVQSDTDYEYKVRAKSANGYGVFSEIISVTTLSIPDITPPTLLIQSPDSNTEYYIDKSDVPPSPGAIYVENLTVAGYVFDKSGIKKITVTTPNGNDIDVTVGDIVPTPVLPNPLPAVYDKTQFGYAMINGTLVHVVGMNTFTVDTSDVFDGMNTFTITVWDNNDHQSSQSITVNVHVIAEAILDESNVKILEGYVITLDDRDAFLDKKVAKLTTKIVNKPLTQERSNLRIISLNTVVNIHGMMIDNFNNEIVHHAGGIVDDHTDTTSNISFNCAERNEFKNHPIMSTEAPTGDFLNKNQLKGFKNIICSYDEEIKKYDIKMQTQTDDEIKQSKLMQSIYVNLIDLIEGELIKLPTYVP